jgi:hypothetical protein
LSTVPVDIDVPHDDGSPVADDEHFSGRAPVVEDRIADGIRGDDSWQGQCGHEREDSGKHRVRRL